MKRLLIVAAICVIAAPAFASSEILPISGVDYLTYNAETGKVTPATAETRYGGSIWACTERSGYFFGVVEKELLLDWGDIAGPVAIGGFGFNEFTNSQAGSGDNQLVVGIYAEENGRNSLGRILLAGYIIDNVPGSTHPPNEFWGYVWGVEPNDPFIIDGSDMDGDDLIDFGYIFWYETIRDAGALMGPAMAVADPNVLPPTAPGIENRFDYFQEPNYYADPNLQDGYYGTYWFGGNPYAQFYFELFAPQCPNRGEAERYCQADIDGAFDCVVGLSDLAQLLSNYGCTTGCTLMMGDVNPYDIWFPGDGLIDLADLAELLSQYGDDCNWPPAP